MYWQEKLRRSGALYTMLERLEHENSRAVYQEGGPLVRPENPQPWMSLPTFFGHCYPRCNSWHRPKSFAVFRIAC